MPVTVGACLREYTQLLTNAGCATARLDTHVLVADTLHRDKAWVLAHPDYLLSSDAAHGLNTKITQRLRHVPLAYIRGMCEFYGRKFSVNTRVLVPRPESEAVIDLLIATLCKADPVSADSNKPVIIDIGTGSGVLAVTSSLEVPHATVVATDIDSACLAVAAHNDTLYKANTTFVQGDVAEPLPDVLRSLSYTPGWPLVLLCNMPYVPDAYPVNEAVRHEPAHAVFGGRDGLDYYRKLFSQLDSYSLSASYIITESLQHQHKALADIAATYSYSLQKTEGLAQLFSPRAG